MKKFPKKYLRSSLIAAGISEKNPKKFPEKFPKNLRKKNTLILKSQKKILKAFQGDQLKSDGYSIEIAKKNFQRNSRKNLAKSFRRIFGESAYRNTESFLDFQTNRRKHPESLAEYPNELTMIFKNKC